VLHIWEQVCSKICDLSDAYHQPIHEAQIYFVFLSVGNPKTVLKGGYVGRKGVSSFASL
jgi:hypothetical protein